MMRIEVEDRDIGRRRKEISDGYTSNDNTCKKRYYHGQFVATEGCFLMLLDVLHGVKALGQLCHEGVLVIEMRRLCEEKFLEGFVFVHNSSICFSLSRPRESCCLTALSDASVIFAISLMLYPLR